MANYRTTTNGSSTNDQPGARRHQEFNWYRYRWRWLLDSLEGGQRYRDTIYGWDNYSPSHPVYNLIRHKREYTDARDAQAAREFGSNYLGFGSGGGYGSGDGAIIGPDPTFLATSNDFELRRARTPIPSFVEEAISTHLGTVFSKEIQRTGIDAETPEMAKLRDWMLDVDGRGTDYDTWLKETFAPLFLVLGQLDLYFDHPRKPADAMVETEADVIAMGLDRCLMRYVLPECILWWRVDPVTGQYLEVDVFEGLNPEGSDADAGDLCWNWTADSYRAVTKDKGEVVAPTPHPYGQVPIVRLFDRRKFRCRNVGHSRYETIADRMKEYYNRDSELIISDTRQAHPLLQGPEDFVQADGSVQVGPNYLLPKKKNQSGTGVTYEGFDYIAPPKDGAESIRRNKEDIRTEVDRAAHLARPAGASTAGTTGQSGVSKVMDSQTAHRAMGSIALSLARCERTIIEYALRCLLNRPDVSALMETIEIVYPTDYDLQSAQDLGAFIADFVGLMEQVGNARETEIIALTRYFRAAMPGLTDDVYAKVDEEIRTVVEAKGKRLDELAEMPPQPPVAAPVLVPPDMVPAAPDDDDVAESEVDSETEETDEKD